ncbi:hypothetical protein CFC21_062891, partial [Triticum aestivum]
MAAAAGWLRRAASAAALPRLPSGITLTPSLPPLLSPRLSRCAPRPWRRHRPCYGTHGRPQEE